MRTAPAGNCARFAAVPLAGGGTSAQRWLTALQSRALPALDLTDRQGLVRKGLVCQGLVCQGLVIVAPHPDDETLGLGATAAGLVAAGVDVRVVSVSDGGAARPEATCADGTFLETQRRCEQLRATSVLGVPPPISLGLPDGELTDHEDRLADLLVDTLDGVAPGTWCAATWRGDGHPDHEAVGRAAATACARTGVTLVEYPVWMWHWAEPDDPAVPWDRAYALAAPDWAPERKSVAAQCFHSQFEPGPDDSPPVLPAFVMKRLLAVGEVVFR